MATSFRYSKANVLLDINNVSVAYDDRVILKNLSAQVVDIQRPGMTAGQIVGLLGPSGVGKTTLFRVLSGLMAPDSGSVGIGEACKPVSAGDVGVVAQSYPLMQHRTVISNLIFAGKQSGMDSKMARDTANASLTEFGLIEHSEKYPSQLSGGQRQRVAIAQQLICSKHYLIMDEPFSGLDVVALAKARKLLMDVANRNEENTFIVVTHDVTSAVAICDTLWLMGRDRDATGNVIPGARIMDTIDLIEEDIAWHDDPVNRPTATALIREIKERFLTL